MANSDLKLISLFAIITAILILRISVENTGYTTSDSKYYLEVAQNLSDNYTIYPPSSDINSSYNHQISRIYFGYWPLGYPVLIATVAFILPISVFWASKVVNFIFLGLCFGLFRKMNKELAYLLALPMCAFTFLEVYSYTWSEAPFLFGILLWGFALNNLLNNNKSIKYTGVLFFASLFLFLVRYVGGFSVLSVGFVAGWFYLQKKYQAAGRLFISFVSLCFLMGFYFYLNYQQTGYLTGGERFYPEEESFATFFGYLFVSLFNELFIIKNYYFRGEPIWLFTLSAAIQLFLMAKIYRKVVSIKLPGYHKKDRLSLIYILLGLFYLIVLIFLRKLSPFDEFDYRLLSPFSLCLYVGIILYLIQPCRAELIKTTGAYKYLVLLFCLSLLMNLPKMYLWETFSGVVREYIY